MDKQETIIVRHALPEDAAGLVEYVQRLSEERGIYILLQPGEFTVTADEERLMLEGYRSSDNSAYFIAETGGQIIGGLHVRGGARRANHHCGGIAISVAHGWRDQGIGNRMLEAAIAWARGSGVLTRLELYVFAENAPAIHLYQKHGFQVEGQLRKSVYRDDAYHDDLVMGLLLDEQEAR